mmetsp:Transcript_4696/g.8068  ORF Transcript_4696/g.8068 Transcript_4696/m.8068 type:complete len:87 (+) Transcript_4696:92-352(+)
MQSTHTHKNMCDKKIKTLLRINVESYTFIMKNYFRCDLKKKKMLSSQLKQCPVSLIQQSRPFLIGASVLCIVSAIKLQPSSPPVYT